MPGSVFANGRSILHKDDGGTQISAVPDVCKTPSPAGPVPIPYPNMSMSSDLTEGTKKVKIQGAMAAHKSAKIGKSTGDEPGTAGGGVVSNCNRGKLMFVLYSMDVKMEGKNAVRFADLGPGNGNSYNDFYPTIVGGVDATAYGDDAENEICNKCSKPRPPHRMWATDAAVAACYQWMDKVEAIAQGYIETRMAWADRMRSQLAAAVFTAPTGSNVNLIAVDTWKKLQALDWRAPVHSSEMKALAAVTAPLKDLHARASAQVNGLQPYKDQGKSLPNENRMFGVVLCRCRLKTGKQWHAYAAISGVGKDATQIVADADYAGFQASVAKVRTGVAGVLAIVNGPNGRPSLAAMEQLERERAAAVLNSYEQLARSALNAIALRNREAQTATLDPGRYMRQITLVIVSKEAHKELNDDKDRIYEWHIPTEANLGPPSVPGLTKGKAKIQTPAGEKEVDTVSWPDGKYEWNSHTPDSNAPFTCAAPKAVKLCQDKGHVPNALCEIVYLGLNGTPVTVSPRTADTPAVHDQSRYKVQDREVKHREVAAHCDTCKELIPKMVCDKEDKECP